MDLFDIDSLFKIEIWDSLKVDSKDRDLKKYENVEVIEGR